LCENARVAAVIHRAVDEEQKRIVPVAHRVARAG